MAQTKPVTAKETPIETGVVADSMKKPEAKEASAVVEVPKTPEVQSPAPEQPVEQVIQEPIVQKTPVDVNPLPVETTSKIKKEIEAVLEEDVKELYLAMNPSDQQKFKAKGEETTAKINEIVNSAKVNAKKIFHLIRGWLKIIPGVSKFFLEQEAKIKTDKILIVTGKEKADQKNKDLL